MTPVDASKNPDNVKYTFRFKNNKREHNVGNYLRNADKRNIFSKGYTSNWNRKLLKVNEVLRTQPPRYRIEDINGEIIEGKYYEQELLKSKFDFESNYKVLESLKLTSGHKPARCKYLRSATRYSNLSVKNTKMTKNRFNQAKQQSGTPLLGSAKTNINDDIIEGKYYEQELLKLRV